MRSILVTGGNGTLGYNILRRLASCDQNRVVALVRSANAASLQPLAGRIDFVEQDLNDADGTAAVFERANPDLIVHCAATGLRSPRPSLFDMVQFNVASSLRLFELNCRLQHPTHFIYVSTGLVYRDQGRPLVEDDALETLYPYAASKAASDQLLQAAAAESKRKLTVLRPFAFTGRHEHETRLFPTILRSAVEGQRMSLSAGRQIRDFCSVDDVVEAVVLIMDRRSDLPIEKFNIGSGVSLPLRTVIEDVCTELELKVDLAFGDREMHPYEPFHSVADISLAEAQLGWKPRTRFAYSVWELAQEIAPSLKLRQPERHIGTL